MARPPVADEYKLASMRWAALALVTLAHACTSLAALAVAPLAPFLLEALALSRAQVGLLLPAIYLGGVLMAPAGSPAPGRRRDRRDGCHGVRGFRAGRSAAGHAGGGTGPHRRRRSLRRVGLYFALVAEIGGSRSAGALTGIAVVFAWSGVLIGPPLFGLLVEAFASYAPSWLLLAGVAIGAAVALARLQPLVQRDPAL